MFFDDTCYWCGEHKVEGRKGNTAQAGVHVYSSEDLYNWKDEGIALSIGSTDSDITRGCILERPKVIYNKETQKFMMWFHLELKGQGYDAARSGVAVSDSPFVPFTFLESVRPNQGFWPVADSIRDKYCGGKGCLPAHVDSVNILGRDFAEGQMARDMNLTLLLIKRRKA